MKEFEIQKIVPVFNVWTKMNNEYYNLIYLLVLYYI